MNREAPFLGIHVSGETKKQMEASVTRIVVAIDGDVGHLVGFDIGRLSAANGIWCSIGAGGSTIDLAGVIGGCLHDLCQRRQ